MTAFGPGDLGTICNGTYNGRMPATASRGKRVFHIEYADSLHFGEDIQPAIC